MRNPPSIILSGLILFILSRTGAADSQIGFCPRPGNALNPTGRSGWQLPDEGGISLFSQNPRSPTGLLYPLPHKTNEPQQTKGGWLYHIFVEMGYLGTSGDDGVGKFNEYGDFNAGLLVSDFSLAAERPADATYVSLMAGGAGRDDQYYQLETGRYGRFEISGYFNSIPHQFTGRAKSIWTGVGSGDLRLRGGLAPGNSSAAQVSELLAQSKPITLQLKREKLGVAITAKPSQAVEVHAKLSTEWRDGSRAFGGTFFYPSFGQSMETIEPIDYLTHDISFGLRYSALAYQLNLGYSGSFFRNDIASLTWDNPGLSAFEISFKPERGRFALSPDNDYHRLGGDFATILPWLQGRLTASVAYSQMYQNEDLLPHSVGNGLAANGFDLAPWSTTAGLSQQSADARINNLTAQAQIAFAARPAMENTGQTALSGSGQQDRLSEFEPVDRRVRSSRTGWRLGRLFWF